MIGASVYVQRTDYEAAGRVDLRKLGADVLRTDYHYYGWNTQGGRMQYLKTGTPGSPTSLQDFTYTYDSAGNVQTLLDARNSSQKQCFTYDGLQRLTKGTTYSDAPQGCTTQLGNGNYEESYAYDSATGNLSSKGGQTLSYNDTNHKHAATAWSGWTYTYDANGNMLTRAYGGTTYILSYDAENRLTGMTGGGVNAAFVYDGDGQRVKGTLGGVTTIYVGSYYEVTTPGVPNASFETAAWTVGSSSPAYPGSSFYRGTWGIATAHSGTYAESLNNLAYGYLDSPLISVSPNTQYDLYAWLRGEIDAEDSAGEWILRVYHYDSSGNYLNQYVNVAYSSAINTTWQQRGGRFTTPANGGKVKVELINYMNSGWVAFDDVSLVVAGSPNNLAPNPGFESAGTWVETRHNSFPGTSILRGTANTAAPHGGSWAYVISNHASGRISQMVTLGNFPSSQHDVSVWVRGKIDPDDSEGAWKVELCHYDTGDGMIGCDTIGSGGPGSLTTNWQQISARITRPSSNYWYSYLFLRSDFNTGWVAFDDASIAMVKAGTQALTDPGFESGSGWTAAATTGFPATGFYRGTWGASAPHSGSYAYSISNLAYGGIDSNFISVKPSTLYTLQAYLKGKLDPDDSAQGWQLRILYYNASYTYLSYQDVDSGTPGSPSLVSWVQRGGSFTSLSNAAYVKVQLRTQMTSGWITFDDIVLQGGAEKVYYAAGGARVAMRDNGTLYYLLGDHLGSTTLVADKNGAKVSEQLYKAWGEKRYPVGASSLPTTYRYTGQRQEEPLKLYFYGARWYDDALGRFIQPDTIIPHGQGVQAWDRFAGMNNNPVRYNDPTGHCILCVLVAFVAMAVILTGDTGMPPQNYPINGWMDGSEAYNCSSSLPGCFGDKVGLKDFSGNGEDNPVPIEEFEEFADEVAEDLYTHDLSWPGYEAGRGAYDTPFYNGGESERRTGDPGAANGFYPADQQVCIETLRCSGRSEINYLAQGMWGAAVGESKPISAGIVITWKLEEYQEWPSEDTFFWLYYGYDYYQQWLENHNK